MMVVLMVFITRVRRLRLRLSRWAVVVARLTRVWLRLWLGRRAMIVAGPSRIWFWFRLRFYRRAIITGAITGPVFRIVTFTNNALNAAGLIRRIFLQKGV